ncbi:hypothetical protein NA78x_004697 [Anatilimnocola sp. NA78]|uniref:hypothetical protein n=1 Tax=Anatilimnocola sp. NA78 TaxID=3415683 RepID=UPI003CE52CA8
MSEEPMMPPDNQDLPTQLLRFLADSQIEVVSWDEKLLTVQIRKEIGAEYGLLEFREPSLVCLPPKCEIAGLRIGSLADLPKGLFEVVRPGNSQLDPDEKIYVVDGSWGEQFFVIATAITYKIGR